jgi:hypothetical protein
MARDVPPDEIAASLRAAVVRAGETRYAGT